MSRFLLRCFSIPPWPVSGSPAGCSAAILYNLVAQFVGFSRSLVGWALEPVQDALLVENALEMALLRRHPPHGLLHHSDRGSGYTSLNYRDVLHRAGMVVSMSRTGNCYDNAVMESFWSTLKWECISRTTFPTRSLARAVIFEYVEVFYNRQRRHSSLAYLSPSNYEKLMT